MIAALNKYQLMIIALLLKYAECKTRQLTQKQPKSAIVIWFGLFFINYDVGADFAHQ